VHHNRRLKEEDYERDKKDGSFEKNGLNPCQALNEKI